MRISSCAVSIIAGGEGLGQMGAENDRGTAFIQWLPFWWDALLILLLPCSLQFAFLSCFCLP